MPTINETIDRSSGDLRTRIITWTPLAAGDDGRWVEVPDFPDASVHVYGTFGGTTITLQGSNEATATTGNAVTLTQFGGAPMSFTANGLGQLVQNPRWIRPLSTGGAGASVTVVMVLRP